MKLLLQTISCNGNDQWWCFFWWLLGAFLLGLLINWLLKNLFGGSDDSDWKAKYDAMDVKYNRLHSSNNQLQKDYDECMSRKPQVVPVKSVSKPKSDAKIEVDVSGDLPSKGDVASGIVAAGTAGLSTAIPYTGDKDDLTKVEGVGPKINEHLNSGGIYTFRHLAEAEVSYLRNILDAAGPAYKVHDPGTWPKQSEFADAGKWDELKKWQNELNGGK